MCGLSSGLKFLYLHAVHVSGKWVKNIVCEVNAPYYGKSGVCNSCIC